MHLDPAWIGVAFSALSGVGVVWNILLTAKFRAEIAEMKLWTHSHFVSKTDQMTLLEFLGAGTTHGKRSHQTQS